MRRAQAAQAAQANTQNEQWGHPGWGYGGGWGRPGWGGIWRLGWIWRSMGRWLGMVSHDRVWLNCMEAAAGLEERGNVIVW